MDAIVTFFIAMMPFLATAPLALALVVISGLVASPRARQALGEWTQRRLGVAPAPPAGAAGAGALEARVRELESRLAFVERLVTLPPRPDAPAALPAPPLAPAPRPNTPPA